MSGILSPWVDAKRMKAVAGFIPENSRILDVGCGKGLLIQYLPKDCTYVGIDNDSAQVEENKKKFPEHFFRDIEASSCVLPFNKEAFDVVVLAAFLPCLKNPRILFSEVARVLKSTGLAVATAPSRVGDGLQGVMGSLKLLEQEEGEFWSAGKLQSTLPLTGLQLAEKKTFEMGLNQIFIFKKGAVN